MGIISYKKIAAFKHQLAVEEIKVLSEFNYLGLTIFIIDDVAITGSTINRLMEIANFGVISLYYENSMRIALAIPDEDLE